jgi:uncharacterized protein YutE (UPF0331/DUF86 family)
VKKLNPDIILARLQKMRELLEFLERYDNTTFEQYCEDQILRLSYERTFQLFADCILDINRHILSTLIPDCEQPKTSNRDAFLAMSTREILPLTLAESLADAVGMRNVLVHMYLEIDNAQVFASIAQCREVYPQYMRQIVKYLDRATAPE